MPQTVLLNHDDRAKAKIVQDALLSSLDGFFIVEWVERCSESLRENAANLAVQLGAQDYLLEDDLDGYPLPKALRNLLERASNAEAL